MKTKHISTKLKTIITLALSVLVMGNTIPVCAAELSDSVASSADNESVGQDTTQGVTTTYGEAATIKDTTYSGSNSVSVYATKTGYVTISVPTTLVLGPDKTDPTQYIATFKVGVTADIAGAQSVTLSANSASLVETGNKNVTPDCTVTLDGHTSKTLSANDLIGGKTVDLTGQIKTSDISAGVYQANMSIGVVINYEN